MPEDLKDALVNTHYVVEYYGLPYPGSISIGAEVNYALPLNSGLPVTLVHQVQSHHIEWGGLAQWLASRTTDQGVFGSRPGRGTVCFGLEQVTFTHCLVLVKPRKPCTDDSD